MSQKISRAEFEANLFDKLNDRAFIEDIIPLLPITRAAEYAPLLDATHVQERIISQLNGVTWIGKK